MSTSSRITAALDFACLMQRLLVRPSRCTVVERRDIRVYHLRALAALNDHELPPGEVIDHETARAAFDAVCKALVMNGVTNADIAAWFNDGASQRQLPERR